MRIAEDKKTRERDENIQLELAGSDGRSFFPEERVRNKRDGSLLTPD